MVTIREKEGTTMILVHHLIQQKGKQVWSVTPETTVYDALRLLAEKNIGALVVLRGKSVVGIFSERDYARKVILKGKSSKDTTVEEIMTGDVHYVNLNHSIEECMALMTDKRVRHLPVLEGENLLGLISIGDVVKGVISEQKDTIQQLENYITGTR